MRIHFQIPALLLLTAFVHAPASAALLPNAEPGSCVAFGMILRPAPGQVPPRLCGLFRLEQQKAPAN